MSKQDNQTTFVLGEIENAKHAVFAVDVASSGRYVVSPTLTTWRDISEEASRLNVFNQEFKHVDYHCEDVDGKFFAFAVADCFDPPIVIVRARSFEDAYESFCDEFSARMEISETDLADYDEDSMSYSASGVPIDTSNVTGFEVQLVSVHM